MEKTANQHQTPFFRVFLIYIYFLILSYSLIIYYILYILFIFNSKENDVMMLYSIKKVDKY